MTSPTQTGADRGAARRRSPVTARSARPPSATCSSSIGDRRYPFIAIREGEAAILDGAGNEIIRHGASGFLGEINLLSGQTVYLTAIVTEPMRYIAVDRDDLRPLLFDDAPACRPAALDLHRAARGAAGDDGIGIEVIGPRSSESTRRIVDYARRSRLPYTWRDPEHAEDAEAAALLAALGPSEIPLVRLPGGQELRNPSSGELSRALGIGLELETREEVDLVVIGGGPAGLGAAVYGASEGLETLVVEGAALGGQAGTSRRIENYLGFPAGISGAELTTRAITQARKFGARTATPYRAARARARRRPAHRASGGGPRGRGARRRARDRRRLPPSAGGASRRVRRHQRLLRGRAARGAALRRHARRRRRWRELGGAGRDLARARRCARDAPAPSRGLARDDVRLPRARPRALRRRRARPQRDRRAARRGRRARVRHPEERRAGPVRIPLLLPRRGAVHGLARRCRRPRRQGLHPHRLSRPVPTACSRRACPASSPPATFAQARSSGARRPSAKARWSSGSCTSTCRACPPKPGQHLLRRAFEAAACRRAPRLRPGGSRRRSSATSRAGSGTRPA